MTTGRIRTIPTLFGVGTPRSFQGRAVALGAVIAALWALIDDAITATARQHRDHKPSFLVAEVGSVKIATYSTDC
jgi:hypothetical protein